MKMLAGIVGAALVAGPFIALLAIYAARDGFLPTLALVAGSIGTAAVIVAGAYLLAWATE